MCVGIDFKTLAQVSGVVDAGPTVNIKHFTNKRSKICSRQFTLRRYWIWMGITKVTTPVYVNQPVTPVYLKYRISLLYTFIIPILHVRLLVRSPLTLALLFLIFKIF